MIIIDPSAYRHMPWKNGGGSTTEIAVSPAGAGLADFDWRVSMARVDGPGPFSAFPGIDRTLSILKGEGLRLDIDGESVTLDRNSAPHGFAADAKVFGTPLNGPITDLNVMTRRGRFRHVVARIAAEGRTRVECRGSTSLILALGACAIIDGDGSWREIPAGGAAVLQAPSNANVELTADGAFELFLIDLFRV